MNIKKDHLNFAVGPVPMEASICQLGLDQVPYFRTSQFSELMLENERIFLQLLGAPEGTKAVFLTGSGTSAMDASVCNVFTPEDKLLIVNGGSFGHRFCEIAACYGIPYDSIDLPSGKALTAAHLAPYEGKDYTGFLINMHETSTGVLYDMALVRDFCQRNGLLLVVDAVSAFLADDISMAEVGADIVFTGSQKALAVPPGIALMAIGVRAQERIRKNPPRCYYLSLKSALDNQERGQTPWTPAVGTLIQINARLNEIAKVGLEAVKANTRRIAEDFRARIAKYPFHIVSDSLSNAVTPLSPDNEAVKAHELFEILKDEYDIIICPNGGAMKDKVFRIGHIGYHTIEDNDALFAAFDSLMARGILFA